MRGFLLLDKPPGITSAEISALVSKLTGEVCGHAGTLDPDVSGVLPIAIGKSRKLLRFISREDKIYIGIAKFNKEISYEKAKEIFSKFIGVVEQTPPLMSAVAKRKRKRKIYNIEVLEVEGKRVLFKAHVEAGTYIRVLCEDVGRLIGKGKMEELRRIKFGRWGEERLVKIEDFYKALKEGKAEELLIKEEEMVEGKEVIIKNNSVESIKNGIPLYWPAVISFEEFEKGDLLKVLNEDKRLVGMARAQTDSKRKEKGLVAKFIRVQI